MKSVRWFLLLTVMMVSGLVSVPVKAQPQDVPFNVEPKVGSAGTRFAFVAFGFRGNERVGVWLNTPDGRAIAARAEQLNRATREGRVDWFWRAPAGIQPGTWQMVARGIDSGVQRIIPVEIR